MKGDWDEVEEKTKKKGTGGGGVGIGKVQAVGREQKGMIWYQTQLDLYF